MPSTLVRAFVRAIVVLAVGSAALAVVSTPASAVGIPTCSAANITVDSLGGPNFYIDSGATPAFRSSYTGYQVTNGTGAALTDTWVTLTGFTGGSLGLAANQAAAERLGDLAAGGHDSLFWYLTATGANAGAQNHTVTVYRHNPALPNAVALCTTTNGFSSVQTTLAASANKVNQIDVAGTAPKLGALFTVTVHGSTGTIGSGISNDANSLWMSPAVQEAWPANAFRLVNTSLQISIDGTAAPTTYSDVLRVAGLGTKDRDYTATYTFQAIGFTATATPLMPVQEITSGTQVKHTAGYPASIPAIQPAVSDLSLALAASPTKLDLGGGTATLTTTVSGTKGGSFDSFSMTLPSGASVKPGTSSWGSTPVSDPVVSGGRTVFSGPFLVDGSALTFDVLFDGTSGDRSVSILGNVGTTQVGGTVTPNDGSNPATASVAVDTAPTAQAYAFATPPATAAAGNVAPLVSDPDGDALTVTSVSGPSHGGVTVAGLVLTYTSDVGYVGPDAFTYTVSDGRGGTASATIDVTVDPEATPPPEPAAQTIDFAGPGDLVVGDAVVLGATATSGLPVSFTSETMDVCEVVDGQVVALSEGDCTITARQDGDADWAPADPVSRTFHVAPVDVPVDPAPQTIDYVQPDAGTVGDSLDVDVWADSGLDVTLTSLTPDVCTVEGLTVTLVGEGTCQLTASQPGDADWAAADDVTISFEVAPVDVPVDPAPQTIEVPGATTLLGLAPYDIEATASSGLPVELTLTDGDCALDGASLTPAAAGTCTVEAAQPGDEQYAAAEPVTFDVEFVLPSDDVAEVHGADSVLIDVLDNDPRNLDLDSVAAPDHGTAVLDDGQVRYTPDASFRGTDSFGYTVTRGGRSAEATVTVAVGNQAPAVSGGRVSQLAGTDASVQLEVGDPNGDDVQLAAVSRDRRVSVTVRGTTLTISADPSASGDVAITVTATDTEGATARSTVRTRVTPVAPVDTTRALGQDGTTVTWGRPPTAGASFEVLLDGDVVCRTTRTRCTIGRIAGPRLPMSVRTVGKDDTRSLRTPALLTGHGQVLVTTVYFASGSAHLTAKDERILRHTIDAIHAFGFVNAHLDGYTDSDGGWAFNLALSKRRTQAVADFLMANGDVDSTQAWHGEKDPAAPNGSNGGKAKNRRVEVLVTY